MDFQQLFSSMLMSSGLSGATGADPLSGAGSGMDTSMFMLPVMFQMMEQLLMKQMELLQAGKLVPQSTADDQSSTGTQQSDELRQPSALLANQARANAVAAAVSGGTAAVNSADAVQALTALQSGVSGHANPYGEPAHGPLTQGYHPGHNGLDIGVVIGTPVHSTMDGKVIYAGWSPIGYGNLVIVQNGDYQTYYAHLSKIPVSVGQSIQAGGVIGLSGSTGNSTGPHLHYEIRYKGKNIDPTNLTLNKTI